MFTQGNIIKALVIALIITFVLPLLTFLNPLFQRFGRFGAFAVTALGALGGLIVVKQFGLTAVGK